ncbi:MAG: GNAT family N-acetyltransferase [Bacteroidota bacterium]
MEYHSHRFHDYSLVIKNDSEKKIVALFPANITSDNVVVSHQGLTYGGLVFGKDEKLLTVVSYFRDILHYLHENGIHTLIYKEIPSIYNEMLSGEMQYMFFLLGAQLIRCDTCTVIKNPFKQPYQRRRHVSIRKAKSLGVEIVNDNNFDRFWESILMPRLFGKHFVNPAHTLEEIKLLHSRFPNQIKQYNAYYKGEIMAGTTIFEMPNLVRAQYASGSNEGRNNGSLDLLFDTVISEVYKDKEYFDFGNSNEKDGLILNRGLLEWKEGLGGRNYAQFFYKMQTENYTILDCLLNLGYVPASGMPVTDMHHVNTADK